MWGILRFDLRTGRTSAFAFAAGAMLAGCGQENQYVAPPPPKVAVANPVQQTATTYLESTGNLTAINTVDLVARVAGFVQDIQYQDGAVVKKGAPLFLIEPEPYRLKLEEAKAQQDAAQAALLQSQAEFDRQADLLSRQVSTQANYDKALAQRDSDRANLENAKANAASAAITYGYTQVSAPFDGAVSARLISIGEYVGANGTPTKLSTIVQVDPIYVNFNISEQDVQTIRAHITGGKLSPEDFRKVPVEVGLQTDNGFPHRGTLDYAAPEIDTSTGTLAVRGILSNPTGYLLPGYYVRVRVPLQSKSALLVPDVALGSDQAGRYVLVVNSDNVVEQRHVVPRQSVGQLRVVETGLKADDRVIVDGLLRAIPGQKVDPQMETIDAAAAPK
ncbi:MAG: efflux RND transporter periplasmic adaptor subunit [Pseudorhodoplanes sp.]|nr:efflux RND transporter periplasmic adaptor subunit [Pseudorhodoplanes sp.]